MMINKKLLIISSKYNIYADLIIQKINQTPEYAFLKEKLVVLHFETLPTQIDIDFNGTDCSFFIKNHDQNISADQIGAVWYCFPNKTSALSQNETTYDLFIQQQFKIILENLYYLTCSNILWVNSPILENRLINKLWHTLEAHQCGLMIPSFLVTNQPAHALNFAKQHPRFCLKNGMHHQNETISPLKMCVTPEILIDVDLETHAQQNHATPLYIQEYLDKKYDIYCVVLNKKCFAYAISSSRSTATQKEIPQCVKLHPLPKIIETAVLKFVKRQNLFYAMIHLIHTKANQYVFLASYVNEQWFWFDIALETEMLQNHFIGEIIHLFE